MKLWILPAVVALSLGTSIPAFASGAECETNLKKLSDMNQYLVKQIEDMAALYKKGRVPTTPEDATKEEKMKREHAYLLQNYQDMQTSYAALRKKSSDMAREMKTLKETESAETRKDKVFQMMENTHQREKDALKAQIASLQRELTEIRRSPDTVSKATLRKETENCHLENRKLLQENANLKAVCNPVSTGEIHGGANRSPAVLSTTQTRKTLPPSGSDSHSKSAPDSAAKSNQGL
jgi:hypothetical protein